MPPKNKSRNAPNQHDRRHESGLAPPGKRVVKRQSNGHLNAAQQPDHRSPSASTSSPPPQPSAGTAGSACLHQPEAAAHSTTHDHAIPLEAGERDRTYSDASLDEAGPCSGMAEPHHEQAASSPVLEVPPAMYPISVPTHAGTTLSAIATILSYYPLRDAISILILLLSLPPTLVLVIQTLFASLTFVPPTTSISLSTLPNVKEWFNSPTLGYPALATILIVDLIFWVVWLPISKPLQAVFLDLSQAVIAVSLSGAAASTGGQTYSIPTTTIIVCLVHVLRYKAIHLTALDYLRSVLHKMGVGTQLDVSAFSSTYSSFSIVERGWLYTVIRTILGIHIVSQGVTTCIRRSLVKANEQSANLPTITTTDPDAVTSFEAPSRHGGSVSDGHQHGQTASSTDGRPPGPSPARRDSKPRESLTKKKRKQANQVRSQQPLWAAIASTKVTFVKEMEQRDAMDDAREVIRMHNAVSNTIVSSAPKHASARAWLRDVRASEILFTFQAAPLPSKDDAIAAEEGSSVGASIDRSKPFFVRINGATWSSTRIWETDPCPHGFGEQYEGEIFGLAPLSSYKCEIVAMGSNEPLCVVRTITQAAPTPEQTPSVPTPPQHQALRPASPITTLKQSIATAETKLNETRNRTKKYKKDQRAGHADIKREINSLKSKLEASGGTDDKQERRLMQLGSNKSQAEDATAKLKNDIQAMGDIPAEEISESNLKKASWNAASSTQRAATKELDATREETDRELSSLKTEVAQAEAKGERLATRRTQRAQELEALLSKQEADMTSRQKRDFDRAQILHQREKDENHIRSHLSAFVNELQMYEQKTNDAYQQIAALQSWSSAQPPPYPGYSSPPTPEGMLPGTNNSALSSPQTNGFPTFGPHPFQSPFHSAHPSLSNVPPSVPRGRSSSMLSQYSGFTDNGDEYSFAPEQPQPQYSWPSTMHTGAGAMMTEEKEGHSSGSASLANGSTGSNSPRPEARPFYPSKNSSGVGTIGPPGKGREKGPQSPISAHGTIGTGR